MTDTLIDRNLDIVGRPPEALFPKNVVLLFFNDQLHKFLLTRQIDVVWFPNRLGREQFKEKEVRGPLPVILSEENGSPAPIFESDDERTWFRVCLPVHQQALQPATEQVTPQVTPQVALQDTEQVTGHVAEQDKSLIKQAYIQKTPQVTPQVTRHVLRLVTALSESMSRGQLQEKLELKDRKHFRTIYLRPALDAGLIEMAVPDKPRSQNQCYRRTEAGNALVRQIEAKGFPV